MTKSTIDMDFDAARGFSNGIHGTCDLMEDWRRKFQCDYNNLYAEWKSDSYFEFLEMADSEMAVFQKKIEALRLIAGKLDAAIAAYWEAQQGLTG